MLGIATTRISIYFVSVGALVASYTVGYCHACNVACDVEGKGVDVAEITSVEVVDSLLPLCHGNFILLPAIYDLVRKACFDLGFLAFICARPGNLGNT